MKNKAGLCVVAGAGPGMGYAIAKRFAGEGYDIVLLARNGAALQAAADSLRAISPAGVAFKGISVDLTDADDIARVFETIRTTMGEPNVLVYNAARWHETPTMEIDPKTFTADLALSVTGGLACAQQVYPAMQARGTGSMLFTGGGLALYPQFGVRVASLAAGKSGLRALVIALQAELESQGIRVGTVTIAGTVAAGTPFDPDQIAKAFWELHTNPLTPVEIVFDGKSQR